MRLTSQKFTQEQIEKANEDYVNGLSNEVFWKLFVITKKYLKKNSKIFSNYWYFKVIKIYQKIFF